MKFQVFPLNEGYYTIGFDKVFHSFDPKIDVLEDRSRGSLLVEIQPFLVQTEKDNILFDTGLGFFNSQGKLVIEENLARYDLTPIDITQIVLSHLHKDHAGGLSYLDEYEDRQETFPNATYHVSEEEYNYAMEEGEPSYELSDLELLVRSGRVNWMDAKGTILDFINYEQDGGHCPYHTSFLLLGDTERYFFGGDNVPQLKQLKVRYMAKYDYDGRRSAQLREEYGQKGREGDWVFMFYHDVTIPLSKLN
jgi:glyoxylase-like metal-dependent hydrolase (beta-lactamase superfamily II)